MYIYIYIQGGWKNRKLQDLRDDCLKTNTKEIVHVICRKLLCYVNWKNKFLTELVETYKLFSIFYIYMYLCSRNAIFLLLFSPQQVWKDNKINGRESRMIDGSWKVINSCSKVAETSVNINGFGKSSRSSGCRFRHNRVPPIERPSVTRTSSKPSWLVLTYFVLRTKKEKTHTVKKAWSWTSISLIIINYPSLACPSRFVSRDKTGGKRERTGAFIAYLLSALTSINGTDDNDLRLAAFRPVPSGSPTSRIPPLRFDRVSS